MLAILSYRNGWPNGRRRGREEREREEGEERKKERRMWGDLEERECCGHDGRCHRGRFRRTGAPWVRG